METIILNIDSRFRNKILYSNAGKFTLRLDESIKNTISIKLKGIEIPNSYFKILDLSSDDKIFIKYNNVDYIIPINKGNYTPTKILKLIQDYFDNNQILITISLCSDNKISLHSNIPFQLSFNSSLISCYLGFCHDKYYSTKTFMSNTVYYNINNDTVINSLNSNYIFIKINDYGNLYTFHSSDAHMCNHNILSKVVINIDKTNYLVNVNYLTDLCTFKNHKNINKLDIELLDYKGNTLNLYNLDFSMSLEIIYINDINENI
jgi:hypothetical protein